MIIHKYILRNHIAPFLFAIVVLISIFMMNFLMKFADNLVGKGLGAWVITKLIVLNLGWIVVLVMPMAVLVATLMAFGNMAQNNEVAVMKAAGISLYKMMLAPILFTILITLGLIQFNNYVYPDSNHALKILMQDISRKKPTLSLVPGVFSQEMTGYAILARETAPETNELKGITIYDYSQSNKSNVVTAKSGVVYFLYAQKRLILDLVDGEIHSYDLTKQDDYSVIDFKNHRIALNGEQFTFQQSSTGGPRSDREMGAPEMVKLADSINVHTKSYKKAFDTNFRIFMNQDSLKPKNNATSFINILYKVRDETNSAKYRLTSDVFRIEEKQSEENAYWVEIHKKYSLPVACLVFLFIGAPLGTMTRKGGFGVAAGISLLFFLIYWAFLVGGEKLADRNIISPAIGIWSANFFLGLLGMYLTVKCAKERVTLDLSFMKKFIPKFIKNLTAADENS